MAAIGFLIIGLACAVVSRILLFIAALEISAAWAVGVFLPFGPLLFRLNYPEDAYRSRIFRFATLPCFFLYLIISLGPMYGGHLAEVARATSAEPAHDNSEKPAAPAKQKPVVPAPTAQPTLALDLRRVANAREFERLRAWNETLRLKKRDLLRSNVEGNLNYNVEIAQYKVALEKANAERSALWPSAK
jgi:hypothetical protein